jgi:2-polyprenyl-3-methyl-5-hydroxy-6-metoxy-1,4-benzoquinol methylase
MTKALETKMPLETENKPTLAPDPVPNRFLCAADWEDPRYTELRRVFEEVYRDELGGEPHPFGAKNPDEIVIHWSREWEYPWAILNAQTSPGMQVCDLGCGGSPLLPYLADRCGCVCWGLDSQFPINKRHNLRAFAQDPRTQFPQITWLEEDMAQLSLPDASMDRVFCISVLEHVGEDVMQRTMAQIDRVLKPGGLALITTDVTGDHRTLNVEYERIIEASEQLGLELHGDVDLNDTGETPGTYSVVGFVLRKAGDAP